jgi:two-component system, OmpR family, response regulator
VSTVPTAKIRVPAAGVALSPSPYVVDELVWMVRWKPWKSVIVIVPAEAETTVPARNGCGPRGTRSGAPEEPGDGVAEGLPEGEFDVAAWATATPPTASATAATPATASRRPERQTGRRAGGGGSPGPVIQSGWSVFTSSTVLCVPEDRLNFSNFTAGPPTLQGVAAARVLVVEDEPVLREAIAAALEAAGFVVLAAADGRELAAAVARFRPDAAVLDISLPGPDGMALARRLRERGGTAVVFVTARDAVSDRLAGFAAGADDYLVKPFVLAELVARLRAVLRRTGRLVSPTVEVGELVLDEDAGRVLVAGEPVALTATELRLLSYLVRNRGRVLSKTQILTQVWGYDEYDPNLVEAHVSALRRKLEARGPRLVHTVRGVGYRVGVTP